MTTTYQISYSCKLDSQVVFSNTDGDPNLVQSEGYIPGGAIWGALAYQVINKAGLQSEVAHHNSLFARWFLRGGLRCLNSYPRLDILPFDKQPIRTLPVPLSLYKKKGETKVTEYYDLISFDTEPVEQLKRVAGFTSLRNGEIYRSTTHTHYNYHTSRKNRSKGRATKGEDGAVFVYEALEAGQDFEGLILGTAEDLQELCHLLDWTVGQPLHLRLGRSRATQYGGNTQLKLLTNKPQEFQREINDTSDQPNDKLVVTLTAPLLAQDQSGYPATQFPTATLTNLLGLPPEHLKLDQTLAQRTIIGGYSGIWKLPRPQWPAFAAGSVFVFCLEDVELEDLSDELFRSAEAFSLGLRTGEGFGRFVLNWHGNQSNLPIGKFGEQAKRPQPALDSLPSFKILVKSLLEKALMQQAQAKGLEAAQKFEKPGEALGVTAALLGRLRLIFRNLEKPEDLDAKLLERFKPPARQQLERLRMQEGRDSLADTITIALKEESFGKSPLNLVIPKDLENNVLGEVGLGEFWQEQDLRLRLVRCYLLALVEELLRYLR